MEPSPADRKVVPEGSAWSPLRIAAFRALWLAQLGSMIGTWMQTVGAQWLLVDEPNASTLVSLVQTAGLLPMLLLALPAGVLADTFDRRRLLIGAQLATFTLGAILAGLTLTSDLSPALLLTFTFLLGAGAAVSMPPWQALIPDIVPRHQVRAAAALGAVSMNLARAIGPALAGFLITQFPVGVVFALNAVTYAVMALVLLRRGPRGRVCGDTPERFVPALRAGARYVRHSKVVRRLLLRSLLFVLPGTALWALLPLVATRRLGLGSGGYGLLLAALGVGAVAGAVVLPRISARLSTGSMIFIASIVYAAAQIGIVLIDNLTLVVALLLPAGAAWLAVLSSLGAATQVFLPGWVRARGLSMQQIVFMGGQAVGALVWGLLAQYTGVSERTVGVLSRHSSATNRVALHRDGPVVLAATDDGHLIVHDIGFAARLPEEENAYRIAAERLAVNPSDSSARLARVRWFAFRGEWARALHAIRAVEPDAQDPERLLEVAIYKLLAGSTLTAYSWVCRCTGLHGISELRARAVRRAAADAFGSMCRARQRPGALPDILTVIPGLAAERDRRGWVALHHAAFGGHVSAIETLLRYGDDVDIRTNDAGKATALIIASELANTSIIRTLLQAGANPNATTSSGHTALHCAALAASEEGVLELLRARADVRALAVNNDTALHLAAERGDGRLISLLLDAGADAQGRNDRGELPTDVALRRRNEHAWIALTYRDGGPGL